MLAAMISGAAVLGAAVGATWSTLDQATLSSVGAVHPSADGKWACYDVMGTIGARTHHMRAAHHSLSFTCMHCLHSPQ